MRILLPLLASVLLSFQSAHAGASVELYMPDAPPLTLTNDSERHGIVGDVTLELLDRAGLAADIQAQPWARAQATVSSGRNLLIIPLSRTPERADAFTWIGPIMPLERAFFSLDAPVQSYDEARTRYARIGIGLGSAQGELLERHGFTPDQIVPLRLGDNPARLLELGRIDAWFTSVTEAQYIWQRQGGNPPALQRSPTVDTIDLYLACSKDCDSQLVTSLNEALKTVLSDGTVDRVRKAYLPW
ncbi:substrate-binding periplasmic protein [Pseudomonas sp. Marseille-QA0892]